jgi:hypothetical protein
MLSGQAGVWRKAAIGAVGASVIAASLFSGSAASQETTTTTTEAPATTTTTEAPATTTTTEVPATTTTTIAPPAGVTLFGDTVSSGTLDVSIGWVDTTDQNCVESIDLAASGQVNTVTDDGGNLGVVYGLADTAGGNAGVLMMSFGAIPVGVAVLSIEDAACSLDVVGVGGVVQEAQRLRIDGVGVGLHPGAYASGEFVTSFVADARVASVVPGANLDLTAVQAFLERPRG